jgi:hypothetical protein
MCRKDVESTGLECQALVTTASDDPLAYLPTVTVGSRGRYSRPRGVRDRGRIYP